MNKFVFLAILVIGVVGTVGIQAQTIIEATKVVRLHEEIGSTNPIPIVKCLDLDWQGQLLAIGGDDHIVRLWNVRDGKFTTQLRKHQESVRSLAFNPNADKLVTVAQDGQIHFWNAQDGRLLHSLKEPTRGTRRVCFQPDGARFAVCGFDKNIRIYDSATYKMIVTLPAHDTNNEAIVY